jgi:hypothetical protein
MLSPAYRRNRGFNPTYTPDQTRHYKSQNVRSQKALNLRALVAEGNYRFLSPRSAVGYWEASLTQGSSGGGSAGSSSGGSNPCAWTPQTPVIGTACNIDVRSWTSWWAPPGSLGEGYYAEADANFRPIYHPGLEPASSQTETTSITEYVLDGDGKPRTWVLSTFYSLAEPSQDDGYGNALYYLVWNWSCRYFYDDHPFIDYGVYPAPPPMWPDGPDQAVYGIAVHVCGANRASSDPGCPYPPPINSGGGGGGGPSEPRWSCTCPDFTKKQAALMVSPYASEQVDRDWSTSNAGTDSDCKHIIAAKLYRRDNFQPSDREPLREPPIPDWLRQENEELRRIRRQWQQEDRAKERDRRRRIRQEREADYSY